MTRLTGFGLLCLMLACGDKAEESVEEEIIDVDSDGVEASLDCDDNDTQLGALADDADCDGALTVDDCDDNDASVYPGADDAWYDGIDSNCDGLADFDQDGDGEASADYDGTDCDDEDATIYSAATEVWYDGIDQNCDGLSDYDQDGDGEDATEYGGVDCLDTDATMNTSATEIWYDGTDQNCNGDNDFDQDGDGVGSDQYGGSDCNDEDASISPNVIESWYDGIDQNCDGLSDYDQDGDGEDSDQHGGTDCDDLDSAINATVAEVWYDGVDQNCDGLSDYDQDGDGEDSDQHSGTDCDDLDSAINTAVAEIWYDGIDQNCDGANDYDQDADGVDLLVATSAQPCLTFDFEDSYGDGWTGNGFDIYEDGVFTTYVTLASGYTGSTTHCPSASTVYVEYVFTQGTYTDEISLEVFDGTTLLWSGIGETDGLSISGQLYEGGDVVYTQGQTGGDCDDTDATIYPGASDAWYDGVDSDCVGNNDYDQDGDGVDLNSGDCDDVNDGIYPGAMEYCDNVDYDCNGVAYEPGLVTYTDANGVQANYTDILSTPRNGVSSFAYLGGGQLDVCEGTYYSSLDIDDSIAIYGHGNVVFDGEGTDPLFYVSSTSSSGALDITLDGLTFQNGFNDYYVANYNTVTPATAGGITCMADSLSEIMLDLNNVEFYNNEGTLGGAMYLGPDCSLEGSNLTMEDNFAEAGGGIFTQGSLLLTNANFAGNEGNTYGGAIYADASQTIDDAIFNNGTTGEYLPTERLDMDQSMVMDNLSVYGGGVFISGYASIFDQVTVEGNYATTLGGGLYQRDSLTHFVDSTIADNESLIGSAIRLYSQSGVSNVVAGTSLQVTANIGTTASSGAIHVTGENSAFEGCDTCLLDGNDTTNTYDMYQEDVGGFNFTGTVSPTSIFLEDRTIGYEDCQGSTDENGNGLLGFDDPWCSYGTETNIMMSAHRVNVPAPTCAANAGAMDTVVVPMTGMIFSGCVSGHVTASENTDMYLSIMEDAGELDCTADTTNTSAEPSRTFRTFVERGNNPNEGVMTNLKISVPESENTVVQATYEVQYGNDCDGNCCYDIVLLDEGGDGWNGGVLNVYQDLNMVETLTFDSGDSDIQTFCVDNGEDFFLVWDDTNQTSNDIESFYVIQGNETGGSLMCVATDISNGIITDCGNNGTMTCQ